MGRRLMSGVSLAALATPLRGVRDRIAKFEASGRSFGVFQGEGEAEHTVRVRFSATVARYVAEGQWHASQQLTRQPDGSLLAEFHLSTTEEIKRWILSFGRHAEVLEPEELRQEIRDECAHVIQKNTAFTKAVTVETSRERGRRKRGVRT